MTIVLRCNLCGSYDAEWIYGERPGFGALALCPKHKAELIAEKERHDREISRLRTINYEQHEPKLSYEYSMRDRKYKWMRKNNEGNKSEI